MWRSVRAQSCWKQNQPAINWKLGIIAGLSVICWITVYYFSWCGTSTIVMCLVEEFQLCSHNQVILYSLWLVSQEILLQITRATYGKTTQSHFIIAHSIIVGYCISYKVMPLTHLQSLDGLRERGVCLWGYWGLAIDLSGSERLQSWLVFWSVIWGYVVSSLRSAQKHQHNIISFLRLHQWLIH